MNHATTLRHSKTHRQAAAKAATRIQYYWRVTVAFDQYALSSGKEKSDFVDICDAVVSALVAKQGGRRRNRLGELENKIFDRQLAVTFPCIAPSTLTLPGTLPVNYLTVRVMAVMGERVPNSHQAVTRAAAAAHSHE